MYQSKIITVIFLSSLMIEKATKTLLKGINEKVEQLQGLGLKFKKNVVWFSIDRKYRGGVTEDKLERIEEAKLSTD